jgi:hypothetical protein
MPGTACHLGWTVTCTQLASPAAGGCLQPAQTVMVLLQVDQVAAFSAAIAPPVSPNPYSSPPIHTHPHCAPPQQQQHPPPVPPAAPAPASCCCVPVSWLWRVMQRPWCVWATCSWWGMAPSRTQPQLRSGCGRPGEPLGAGGIWRGQEGWRVGGWVGGGGSRGNAAGITLIARALVSPRRGCWGLPGSDRSA